MMSNVCRIGYPEYGSSIQKDIANDLNNGCLLPLSYIQDLQQMAIALSEVENVSKDGVDKLIHVI